MAKQKISHENLQIMNEEIHAQMHEEGIEHDHDALHHHHSIEHSHPHHHDAASTKAIINRMNRAIGHMESIKTMIQDDRDCSEVLIQIAAVKSAVNNIGKLLLEDHINHCVVDAIETGDKEVLAELKEAIDKFVK